MSLATTAADRTGVEESPRFSSGRGYYPPHTVGSAGIVIDRGERPRLLAPVMFLTRQALTVGFCRLTLDHPWQSANGASLFASLRPKPAKS